MNNSLMEKTLKETVAYEGSFLKVKRDRVSLPDGRTAYREYIEHPGAAAVVALTENNEILMVRQYRHPLREISLEIPAGKMEPGSTPLENCKRELREETGAVGYSYVSIGAYVPVCSYSEEIIHLYMCRVKDFGDTDFDDDEFIETEKIPLDKAVEMVLNNQILDGKSQTAILKAKMLLSSESSDNFPPKKP